MEGFKMVPHFRYEKFDSVNQRYQIVDMTVTEEPVRMNGYAPEYVPNPLFYK